MNLLMALIFGAAPAPDLAFDVPIQEITLGLHGQQILRATPGRCELWAPGQAEPTRVTSRLRELAAQDVSSLLMTSLGQGHSATAWRAAERPRGPYVDVTVVSALGPGGTVLGWSSTLALTPYGGLMGAWRLYSLFSLCNLGEAYAVWVALAEDSPPRRRALALALLTEWVIWVDRERYYDDWDSFPHDRLIDCYDGTCEEELSSIYHNVCPEWATTLSPRSFDPLERSPPVEAPAP